MPAHETPSVETNPQPRLANRWRFEQRMLHAALLAVVPATSVVLALLWFGDYSARVRLTVAAGTIVTSGIALLYLWERWVYSLRTIANLLSAVREGDFSIRLRTTQTGEAIDELIDEANALRDTLHRQRIEVAESGALVDRVLAGIDVAILAFDGHGRLRRANPQAEALLGAQFDSLVGRTARELRIDHCLTGATPRIETLAGDMSGSRWELRRTTIRHLGEPLQLIMLWDVTAALRNEQQEAWSRLIRVMRHEINNSLAPISSLATTMLEMAERNPPPPDWRADLKESLSVIEERSAALARMLQAYTELSCEPAPVKRAVDVASLVRRVVAAETRADVAIHSGGDLTVLADPDQLDRALLNLVRNAVDANLATGGRTSVGWTIHTGLLHRTNGVPAAAVPAIEFWIDDEGPGLLNTDNLFVPFFTTKPGGSGVGLALARHIAEAHGGSLTVANRADAAGCRSSLRIPLDPHS